MIGDPISWLEQASAAAQRRDQAGLERALERMDQAARSGGNSSFLQLARGRTLIWLKRPLEAAAALERAIVLDPGNAHAWFHAGLLRAAEQDHAGARAAFAEASRLDPSFVDAAWDAGQAASRLGRHEEAVAHFATALRARPADAELLRRFIEALRAVGRDDDAERATTRLTGLVSASDDPAIRAKHELIVERLRLGEDAVVALQCVRPRSADHHVELAFVTRGGALVAQLEHMPGATGAPYVLTLVSEGERRIIGPAFSGRPSHAQVRLLALAALEREISASKAT